MPGLIKQIKSKTRQEENHQYIFMIKNIPTLSGALGCCYFVMVRYTIVRYKIPPYIWLKIFKEVRQKFLNFQRIKLPEKFCPFKIMEGKKNLKLWKNLIIYNIYAIQLHPFHQ